MTDLVPALVRSARWSLLGALACCACSTEDAGPSDGGAGASSAGSTATSSGGTHAGGLSGSAGTPNGGASGGTASAGTPSGGTSPGTAGSAGTATGGTPSGGSATAGTAGSGTAGASGGGAGAGGAAGGKSKTTFFVTSDTSMTGNLGGLTGADKRCQDLAVKAGIGDHTFHAYLSTTAENARDRIGKGPWVNAKGITVAPDLSTLHSATTKGDPQVFIDEYGAGIHGQWDGGPVEHDVLTGSTADGSVQAGKTCMDWTSNAANLTAQVGHSDGMGPNMATTGTYTSWNSSHENGSCADTAPRGGAGRLYCFAID